MSAPVLVTRENLVVSLCKGSFEDFVRVFWPLIPGTGGDPPVWNWHMSFLCRELQEIAERVFRGEDSPHDTAINVPPGTSKSSIVSILFPAWVWTRMPVARFICASHTDSLVIDLAVKSKAVIEAELYQACWPAVRIAHDRSAKQDYANTAGGERKSCTVGGKTPMGRHSHFILIDDPIDPQGALSEAELLNARNFMTAVIPWRKVNKQVTPTVLVMQRLHRQDPTAVMEEVAGRDGATPLRKICLPGETTDLADVFPEECRAEYVRDGDGWLLDPARLPRRTLKDAAARMGAYAYSGQVLQRPAPAGGGMFKEEWFQKHVRAAPYHAKRIMYVDRASTLDGGCYTAIVLMAKDADGAYYVEHCLRGQWEPVERNDKIRDFAVRCRARYGPRHVPVIWVEAEGGSSGRDAWVMLTKALSGFVVREHKISRMGDKDVRAEPWAVQLAAGNVYLVEDGTWDLAAYVEEHALFKPEKGMKRGRFKDQVDASSGAWAVLTDGLAVGGMRTYSLGRQKPGARRVVACSREELASLLVEQRAVLAYFRDPALEGVHTTTLPGHALDNLLDAVMLDFADLDPADYQDRWDDPVMPWGRPPADLVMTPQHGKALWAKVLRKRDPDWEVLVIADEGDRRAHSAALGVCEVLRLDPTATLWVPGLGGDNKVSGEPGNRHVYETARASRALVM